MLSFKDFVKRFRSAIVYRLEKKIIDGKGDITDVKKLEQQLKQDYQRYVEKENNKK